MQEKVVEGCPLRRLIGGGKAVSGETGTCCFFARDIPMELAYTESV